jgi:predicted thioredoxin/glutaredoxin
VTPPRLTLVQRRDCALCEEMLSALTALGRRRALPPLDTVDVDSDPVLQRRHGLDVPVLLLDGTVVCRHRLDAAELERLLRDAPVSSPAHPRRGKERTSL